MRKKTLMIVGIIITCMLVVLGLFLRDLDINNTHALPNISYNESTENNFSNNDSSTSSNNNVPDNNVPDNNVPDNNVPDNNVPDSNASDNSVDSAPNIDSNDKKYHLFDESEYIFGSDLPSGTYQLTAKYTYKENEYLYLEWENSTKTCMRQMRNIGIGANIYFDEIISFGDGARIYVNEVGEAEVSLVFISSEVFVNETDSCISV
jgi:hypothetical protein